MADRLNPDAAIPRRYASVVEPALRDSLREFIRTAQRRHLSSEEVEMGLAMLDELETRFKDRKLG